jgi:hypothetical protein
MLDDINNKRRELSWLVAALLLSCLLSFLIGYFVGHRAAACSFVDLSQEEIAAPVLDEMTIQPVITAQAPTVLTPLETQAVSVTQAVPVAQESSHYYALITTVDSYALATNLAAQAAKVGVQLRIKKAVRALSRGRHKRTHQLVTPPYQSREVLERDLATLKTVPAFAKIKSNQAIKQGK